MGKSLVIVESPAKAKTINSYLGPNFIVEASFGHVRDLPKKDIAIDIEGGFVPTYVAIDRRGDILDRLRRLSKQCDKIFLATDPDREGEAIAWHLAQEIADDAVPLQRVLFSEITKSGVAAGMRAPRAIDMDLVKAQEARRVMDRLIGYKISPFLWKAFRGEETKGLSAGRVQTAALRLVAEREMEINSFIAVEYWNLLGTFKTEKGDEFVARLIESDGVPLVNPRGTAVAYDKKGGSKGKDAKEGEDDPSNPNGPKGRFISEEKEAKEIRERALKEKYEIASVTTKESRRTAPLPFTTSTLQQDAGRRLKMKPKDVMAAAQKLYEGVEVTPGSRVGLITYMRTDSTRISDEAASAAEQFVFENYGKEYIRPKSKSLVKPKKNVQDAHEAIRPADLSITPKKARKSLDPALADLYELIYRRFVASQMADALFDRTVVDIRGGAFLFRAVGRVPTFRGWLQVYDDAQEIAETKKDAGDDDEEGALPTGLTKGKPLDLTKIDVKKRATVPPPRFTESTLVKELEARGIGRPSTYAQTIATIMERGYVTEQYRRLHATELGIRVCSALTTNFPTLFDVSFTARMEKDLDTIAAGTSTYLKVMQGFYKPFSTALKTARLDAGAAPRAAAREEEARKPPRIRKTTRTQQRAEARLDAAERAPALTLTCDKCGSGMELREGKYGPYYACTSFPKCARLIPAAEAQAKLAGKASKEFDAAPTSAGAAKGGRSSTAARKVSARKTSATVAADGPTCSVCGAPMIKRKSATGEFYGCSAFPNCRQTMPIGTTTPCPECKTGHMVERKGGASGDIFYGCSRYPECRHTSKKG